MTQTERGEALASGVQDLYDTWIESGGWANADESERSAIVELVEDLLVIWEAMLTDQLTNNPLKVVRV